MTLTLDAVGGGSQGSGLVNPSYTHTPVGNIDAILLVEQNGWLNSITCTAVTYGGVALAAVCPGVQITSGDAPSITMWFKSGGLPTGPQTVAISDSTNTVKLFTSWGLIGSLGNGLEVQTVERILWAGGVTNPTVTMDCQDDREAFIGGALSHGNNTITGSELAGQTSERTSDFGAYCVYQSRKTSIHAGGDTTFGRTMVSAQAMMIAAAVSEILTPQEAHRYPKAIML